MPLTLNGRWHLLVTKAIHKWPNRFVVEGAQSGNGIYPGTVGTGANVDGSPGWLLRAEHENPAEPGVWHSSQMQVLSKVVDGAEIHAVLGAEDPLPNQDFEDIQWTADFTGRLFDVPYRPYAVRTQDLFQMPDGIFDTLLGVYYMGVRVRNTWGESFGAHHVLSISPNGRATLAANGIRIIDAWTHDELARLGQVQIGSGMSLAGMAPGDSRTLFFKIDVSEAAPRKYEVEFMHLDMSGTPDPMSSKRLLRRNIFVSSSSLDEATGELVCQVDAGTVRLSLHQVAYDHKGFRRSRNLGGCPPRGTPSRQSMKELRRKLQALVGGRIDPCELLKAIQCHCRCERPARPSDPLHPCDDRYTYGPFYMVPTRFSYTVEPRTPFVGQYGALPFEDPWWKVALLILAVLLLIAGALSEGANTAYHDEDLVIGTLARFQQNDIDAALCRIGTSRALHMLEVTDALSGEPNTNAVTSVDGVIGLSGPVMTRAEINNFLVAGDIANLRVFKSGARTGLTFGIISSTTSDGHSNATWGLGQLKIDPDPDPAFGNNVQISDSGDSGSIWVHHLTRRPVGLHHTGPRDTTIANFAVASLLEDVQLLLQVTI
jgi:hypothetical protein